MQQIKKPRILTIVCVIAFTIVVIGFPYIFSPFVKKKGDFFPAILGLFVALQFIAIVGVWFMKKWGVMLYLGTAMANQALLIWIDDWQITSVILPTIFLSISLFFYKRMDNNL